MILSIDVVIIIFQVKNITKRELSKNYTTKPLNLMQGDRESPFTRAKTRTHS